ncbi:hypothetical protein [Heyndrickxia oleronia]|jgi:hypothetical protein|uniref:hypothetical protein n=1 Tax=Heyndrickxia oleronia TaxID=38875 RepID=UPI000A97F164|nr:hypothetical protein [Heyndrickxia oleronia]MBU5210647.1 hypothetical protein [Heyndrickxia oleronia]
MLGVKTKYKLIGSDHKNDMHNKNGLDNRKAKMAKQAGRNNIKKVMINRPNSL